MALVKVSTEAVLKGKIRKDFAWNIISDFMRYKKIMENVEEVKIIERNGNEGKSEWFINVENAPLTWIERDYFDENNYEIKFESIAGDMEIFNGKWKVEDCNNEGIKIFFNVEYELGIPVIEEVLGHILKEKMQSNINSMVNAIKDELTKTQVEERKYKRYDLKIYNNIILNDKEIRVYILNLSQKGMYFYYDGQFDSQNINVQIGTFSIEAEQLYNDIKNKNIRIVFKTPISKLQIKELLEFLKTRNFRKSDRKIIEKNVKIKSFDKIIEIFLINISQIGMYFQYQDKFVGLSDVIEIGNVSVKIKDVYQDVHFNSVRVAFEKPINNEDYTKILRILL